MKAKTYKDAKSLRNTEYSIMPELDDFVNRLLLKYGNPIAAGRNRTVFASKNFVFKVPRCEEGCYDNEWESSISGDIYPMSKLLVVNGIGVVIAQKVRELPTSDWASMAKKYDWILSVDCSQVGFTNKGKLVAFDYGRY